MASAAYNRGTAKISRDIDASLPRPATSNELFLADLNAIPKGSGRLFQATVIRYDKGRGWWWLMNKQETGWASYGEPHELLREVAVKYALEFVAVGRDKDSLFVQVEPA